jgi:transcriptional regulator with XRE-family HTH domain
MKITDKLTDDAIAAELGRRLAAARLARGLTQAALAHEAGVSKRTVERLESGEVGSRLTGLVRVLRTLGLAARIDTLLDAAVPGPIEQLKLTGRRRQRAPRAAPKAGRKWTWGDES